MGTTPIKLSREPLATEGEATIGPDDEVNFDDLDTAGPSMPDLPPFRLDVEPPSFWEGF
jgi:hypothetical protein